MTTGDCPRLPFNCKTGVEDVVKVEENGFKSLTFQKMEATSVKF